MIRWRETDKGDPRCRALADRHYTRQTPGHPQWTRPGWNQILFMTGPARDGKGEAAALFVWWRPKWESGLQGTGRKDRLRCIECTHFRNETAMLSSELVTEAVAAVQTWKHATDVEWPDGLITGIGSDATARGRSKRSLPGKCFRVAGWVEFEHAVGRADVWLRFTARLPPPQIPPYEPRGTRPLPLGVAWGKPEVAR